MKPEPVWMWGGDSLIGTFLGKFHVSNRHIWNEFQPVHKVKKRLVSTSAACSKMPEDSENLPSNICKFGLFKKKRNNPAMSREFLTSYKPKVSDAKGPASCGPSHVYDGLGGHKRFNDFDPLRRKLDRNKNVRKPRNRKEQSNSFSQLNITEQLICLEWSALDVFLYRDVIIARIWKCFMNILN